MADDVDVGIDLPETFARSVELAATDVSCAVEDLALEIGRVDLVEVDQSQCAHAGCRQIQGSRRSQATGSNERDSGLLERPLPLGPHLPQRQVTRVPRQLGSGEVGERRIHGESLRESSGRGVAQPPRKRVPPAAVIRKAAAISTIDSNSSSGRPSRRTASASCPKRN